MFLSFFGVGSGIVIDKWKRQSPQVDLVIFDRRRLPPLLEQHGHGIYPMDAVLRVIEVKSTLDGSGLKQFAQLIKCFDPNNAGGLKLASKGNLEDGHSYYPFALLFAYTSKLADLSTAVKKVDGLIDEKSIYIVNGRGSTTTDAPQQVVIRAFLIHALGAIEASANSRKEYSIIKWLSDN